MCYGAPDHRQALREAEARLAGLPRTSERAPLRLRLPGLALLRRALARLTRKEPAHG